MRQDRGSVGKLQKVYLMVNLTNYTVQMEIKMYCNVSYSFPECFALLSMNKTCVISYFCLSMFAVLLTHVPSLIKDLFFKKKIVNVIFKLL